MAIEQGVPDNHDYILTGESDEVPGVIAGDLYMRVKLLSHERYERRGADLLVKRSVTLLEALTGVTLRLEHLDGKEYVVATSLGDVLEDRGWKTLPKLGMPFYK